VGNSTVNARPPEVFLRGDMPQAYRSGRTQHCSAPATIGTSAFFWKKDFAI
jgi:hypothetical protein